MEAVLNMAPVGVPQQSPALGGCGCGAELSLIEAFLRPTKGFWGGGGGNRAVLGFLTQLGGDGGTRGGGAGSQDGVQDTAAVAVAGEGQEMAL